MKVRSTHEATQPYVDPEVQDLEIWIGERVREPLRGEKQIANRELNRILGRLDSELRIPGVVAAITGR